jgi:hypothetical protein
LYLKGNSIKLDIRKEASEDNFGRTSELTPLFPFLAHPLSFSKCLLFEERFAKYS